MFIANMHREKRSFKNQLITTRISKIKKNLFRLNKKVRNERGQGVCKEILQRISSIRIADEYKFSLCGRIRIYSVSSNHYSCSYNWASVLSHLPNHQSHCNLWQFTLHKQILCARIKFLLIKCADYDKEKEISKKKLLDNKEMKMGNITNYNVSASMSVL